VTLRCVITLILFINITLLGERGVTIGIRAGRSVRPISRVVSSHVELFDNLYCLSCADFCCYVEWRPGGCEYYLL
jgi:hypothetical protein